MVSEPSTPGAYLSPGNTTATTVNLSPKIHNYIAESKNSNEKVDLLIDSILRD